MKSFKMFLEADLLLENKIEFLKNHWKDKISSAHDDFAVHKDSDAIIDHFATHADPTPKKLYTNWIVKQYHQGHIRQEDAATVHSDLKNFDKYKPRLEEKDINKYKHVDELRNAVRPHLGQAATHAEAKKIAAEEGTEVVHDDHQIRVQKILTHAANRACLPGDNNLCTAADSDRGKKTFEDYSKNSPIYIITDKTNGNKKYQLHHATNQFKDPNNQSQDRDAFHQKFPQLKTIPALNGRYEGTTERYGNTTKNTYKMQGLWSTKHSFNDEPSSVSENGEHKEWHHEGRLHRESGPAVIHGGERPREEWYKHDYLHRIGGPAYTSPEKIEYHQEGKLHREDGPAQTEYHDRPSYREPKPPAVEKIAWFKHGVPHRIGGPSLQVFSDVEKDGTGGGLRSEEWRTEGKLHSQNDQPSKTSVNMYDDRKTQEWHKDEVLHREVGPAKIETNGSRVEEKHFHEGLLHRVGGPAHTVKDSKNPRVNQETWYQHGTETRDDGPSHTEASKEHWKKDGEFHRIGGPAVTHIDSKGETYKSEWYEKGLRHRIDGPAVAAEGEKQHWYKGYLHRENGPAIETQYKKIYMQHGVYHSQGDVPSYDNHGLKVWHNKGVIHRVGGPAVIRSSGVKEWRRNGQLHRPQAEGPAVEEPSGAGQFHEDGQFKGWKKK